MIVILNLPSLTIERVIKLPEVDDRTNDIVVTTSSAISTDEEWIIVTSTNGGWFRSYVFSLLTGELIWEFEPQNDAWPNSFFSHDSNRVVVCSRMYPYGGTDVACVDPFADSVIWQNHVQDLMGPLVHLAKDGTRVISNSTQEVVAYEFPSLELVSRIDIDSRDVYRSDNGEWLTSYSPASVVDVATGRIDIIDNRELPHVPSTDWNYLYLYKVDEIQKVKFNWGVSVEETTFISSLDVAPNPCENDATVTVVSKVDQEINVSLYDNLGRFVRQMFSGFIQSGPTVIDMICTELSIGSYLIRTSTNGHVQSIPFFKN